MPSGARAIGITVSTKVMHDPVDIRRRIDRAFARVDRRDDYGRVLARGAVVHAVDEVDDVETWRAAIRREAGADRVEIRTGLNEGVVRAMPTSVPRPDEMAAARRYRELLLLTVPIAVHLRHEPILALADGDEMVCSCGRCYALGYGHAGESIVDGHLFEDECPNEEPPKLTALTMMHVSGSR